MSLEIDEKFLTSEYIERLKKQDPRINELDLMVRLETELRESLALKIVLEAASEQAAEALEELAAVAPTDTDKIIRYQAKVYRARFIARTLNNILEKGRMAEQSLNDEQAIELNKEQE